LLFLRLLEQGWLILAGRAAGSQVADEAAEAIRQLGGDKAKGAEQGQGE